MIQHLLTNTAGCNSDSYSLGKIIEQQHVVVQVEAQKKKTRLFNPQQRTISK
jgi:hypothetical protein